MKKFAYIIFMLLMSTPLISRSVELLYGQYFFKSKVESGDPTYCRTSWDNRDNFRIRVGYRPLNNQDHKFKRDTALELKKTF